MPLFLYTLCLNDFCSGVRFVVKGGTEEEKQRIGEIFRPLNLHSRALLNENNSGVAKGPHVCKELAVKWAGVFSLDIRYGYVKVARENERKVIVLSVLSRHDH